MFSTRTSFICLRISSGMSRRSFSFFFGRMTIRAPDRCAARILLLSPPIGRTRPRRVISPVIATSLRTGMPVSAETIAVAIVTPADGPSLGMAPAGTWMWSVFFSNVSRGMPSSLACARDPRQSGPSRLAHDLAQLAGEDEVLLAFHPGDLDGDDVAADLGHDEPGRRTGLVLALELAVLAARRPEELDELLAVDDGLALAALGDRPGDLAHDVRDLALEVPDAGLLGVGLDELGHRLVGDLDVLGREAVVLPLLGDEEPLADLDLLLLGVARQLDDLHPVAQRRRDRVDEVAGRDEQHLGQVERHLEVVVLEGVVLLGVEDLEEGRRRVAPEVHPDLVDLVEHEDRVVRAGGLDALDDPARERPDVGPSMAPDLGLVVDAAEAHPDELATHRPRDALAERRLADAGRADEGEDRAADRVRQGPDREVLEDPLLDLLEAVVVLVEDLCGALDVELVVGRDVPGQADEPVHVRPDDADLGRGGRDPAHPVDFLERPGLDLLRHAGGLDLVAQFGDLGLLRVVLAELALDGLELLSEDVLPLGLVHLGLDLALDLPLELEDLDLACQEVADELEALGHVDRLEQLLALLGRHVGAVGDHVGQQPGLGDVASGDGGLGRDRRAVGDVLLDLGLDGPHQGLDLDTGLAGLGDLLDDGPEVRVDLGEAADMQPTLSLDDGPDGPVLELDDLGDLRQGADGVELGRVGDVLLLSLALGDEGDRTAVGDGGIERVHALLASDLERHDHLGEDDRLPERHEGQLPGHGLGPLGVVLLGRSTGHSGFSCGCLAGTAGLGATAGPGPGRRRGLAIRLSRHRLPP